MNQLIAIGSSNITMTSREISELVESRHDSVKRTIVRLAVDGVIQSPPLVNFKNSNNVEGQEYIFTGDQGKRDSIIVVAQLSPEFTARLVDRWQELESKLHLIPQTLPEALRLAADLAEQNALLAPKAAIADRLVTSEDAINLMAAAKVFGVPPQKLNKELNRLEWIYKRPGSTTWLGYQDKINAGYLDHKFYQYTKNDGSEGSKPQVLVLPKGMAKLTKIYGQPELFQ